MEHHVSIFFYKIIEIYAFIILQLKKLSEVEVFKPVNIKICVNIYVNIYGRLYSFGLQGRNFEHEKPF